MSPTRSERLGDKPLHPPCHVMANCRGADLPIRQAQGPERSRGPQGPEPACGESVEPVEGLRPFEQKLTLFLPRTGIDAAAPAEHVRPAHVLASQNGRAAAAPPEAHRLSGGRRSAHPPGGDEIRLLRRPKIKPGLAILSWSRNYRTAPRPALATDVAGPPLKHVPYSNEAKRQEA